MLSPLLQVFHSCKILLWENAFLFHYFPVIFSYCVSSMKNLNVLYSKVWHYSKYYYNFPAVLNKCIVVSHDAEFSRPLTSMNLWIYITKPAVFQVTLKLLSLPSFVLQFMWNITFFVCVTILAKVWYVTDVITSW